MISNKIKLLILLFLFLNNHLSWNPFYCCFYNQNKNKNKTNKNDNKSIQNIEINESINYKYYKENDINKIDNDNNNLEENYEYKFIENQLNKFINYNNIISNVNKQSILPNNNFYLKNTINNELKTINKFNNGFNLNNIFGLKLKNIENINLLANLKKFKFDNHLSIKFKDIYDSSKEQNNLISNEDLEAIKDKIYIFSILNTYNSVENYIKILKEIFNNRNNHHKDYIFINKVHFDNENIDLKNINIYKLNDYNENINIENIIENIQYENQLNIKNTLFVIQPEFEINKKYKMIKEIKKNEAFEKKQKKVLIEKNIFGIGIIMQTEQIKITDNKVLYKIEEV